jgi:hypothetical protein
MNGATIQALVLVCDWFFETGSENQSFSSENPLTQEVEHDAGMDQFKEKWSEAGYPEDYTSKHTADDRSSNTPLPARLVNGTSVFLREHFVELGLSVLGFGSQDPKGTIDAVGGTLGSLDSISVTSEENGYVKFTVYNEMGWASGTRIPGTNSSLLQNRDRKERGPGGTTSQTFYWYEKVPQKYGGER